MFRFFQKMRQKLVVEGRFSNYLTYAIGEIVLVVVGILIALAINNWNQNRKDRIREQMYLHSFKTDLQECQTELQRVFIKTERVKNSCKMLLDIGNGIHPYPSPNVFDSIVSSTFGYTMAMTNEGTLNDIKQSVDLKVIQNDTLRRMMASWDAGYKLIRELEWQLKDDFMNHRKFMNLISIGTDSLGILILPQNRHRVITDTISINNLSSMLLITTRLNKLYEDKIEDLDSLIALTHSEINN